MIHLPDHVKDAIYILEQSGHTAFCVGGCVRDSLMGITPHDWDIATSAQPSECLGIFKGFTVVPTGLQHGTVTVVADGHSLEITTYRIDGIYKDCRRPSKVYFTDSIKEDLGRRDFTVNAIAYNEKCGYIDPFGGMDDIKRHILKAVGNAEARFSEDALRIMRCVRFAAQLGFSVDANTKAAAVKLRQLLKSISTERIQAELSKTLCGFYAEVAMREYSQIIFTIAPELHPMLLCHQETAYHCFDVWEHTLHAIGLSPPDLCVRLALLLHDSGKPGTKSISADGRVHFHRHSALSAQITQELLHRLRYPVITQRLVKSLVILHNYQLPMKKICIKRMLQRLGNEGFFLLMKVYAADISAQSPEFVGLRLSLLTETIGLAQALIEANICLSLNQLAVKGKDLLALGCPPGKHIGCILEELLELVLLEQLPNKRERLLKTASRRIAHIVAED